jgi:rhomboid protease GluP
LATDGEIDFGAYTREQLDNAVSRMDRYRFPINYRNLVAEYQRRRVAERQAQELAVESGTVAPLDNMLSVPRVFAVKFEPNAGLSKWLAPSRNDFHLVASGTVQVDGAVVRVTGRRFSILMGLPLTQVEELGRQFVVNVECDGVAVRFELRVPGEKIRGVVLWFRSAGEAEELSKSLPIEHTPDFTPHLARHVEFERSLTAQSPKTPVTYGLVVICVLVYLTTAIDTGLLFGFDGPSLVRLGSNFGPYTADGDWWRLLTSMFLHLGLIHLAFNMWALASFGPLVERLYGSVTYLVIYMVAGLAGALASISWRPEINSIGASGAIFGILGALIAAQLRNARTIPESVLKPLRNSSIIFIGCALFAGLASKGVDNAAHIGGMAAGFLVGLAVSRPVTGRNLDVPDVIRRCTLGVPLSIILIGAGVLSAQHASQRLTAEGLFARTMHWFAPREIIAISRWHDLGVIRNAGKWDDNTYASALDAEVIPFWRDAVSRLDGIELAPTSPSYNRFQFLRNVANGRLRATERAVRGLRLHDAEMSAQAVRDMRSVDEMIADTMARDKQQP